MNTNNNQSAWKKLKYFLFRPSTSFTLATLVVLGIAIGFAGILGFQFSLKATSTTEFCVSCHEMESALASLKTTPHFNNKHGFNVGCADCHIPHEFAPKMIRKVQAAREVWGHLTGVIDTEEKYRAMLPDMAEREIARLKANDSAECRNCHDASLMDIAQQSKSAQKSHKKLLSGEQTCIDCHEGIAHGSTASETDEENFEL